MRVDLLDQRIHIHAVYRARLLDRLPAGSRAAQAMHPDLQKICRSAGIRIQNVANDGIFRDLCHV